MSGAQEGLDLGGADLYGKPRRVEAAVTRAVEAADLDDRDEGAAALAVEVARSVDVASGRRDPYGVAAAARELRETLARLGMDPESRRSPEGGGDPDKAFIDWLTSDDDASIPH